ncbi:argininosuccinate synthase-related protein [Pseudomonas typographi]|uniref:argininosuccinate synthase n=1 Tax=Pseudomonas typographi TaxID=2715964 RepID=A0ABR7Z7U0_9PSED|nr:argininosuccinate synthase-related protein [Pseudomonas typographi]MBD1554558.1 argininosuccinate synthase [Pseudomonas typographi]MBD1588621.1 argininosuccinate synthase [Pseudomonas typographi]MBD1601591.1 argininosuccinate synthase [Pseudomonas typographi]
MTREMDVRSLEDLAFIAQRTPHILTLFSGGLDSSYLLYQLSKLDCKVTALAVDLGEGADYAELARITNFFGATLKVVDGRSAFVEDAVLPAIQAHAQYLGQYPISSSLSRPIIARFAVAAAHRLGCGALLHTANQSQNSLRRLNGAIKQLGYTGFTGSPYEYSALSREEKIAELNEAGLCGFQSRGMSGDANLWVREYESGCLDNPENFSVSEDIYSWTRAHQARDHDQLEIEFREGRPFALNRQILPLIELIHQVNHLAGSFQIGRYSGLEHLEGGEKVLEVREAPAAAVLLLAYRTLETAVLDAELIREKIAIEQLWVREAIEGRWFGALHGAASAFVAATAKAVSGKVTLQLSQGCAQLAAIKAPSALYLTDRDGWEKAIARERGSRTLAEQHTRRSVRSGVLAEGVNP